MEYGTGAIMGVPGHDERDFEFATAYSLPIIRVVASSSDPAQRDRSPLEAAYTNMNGVHLTNSGQFNRMGVGEGKRAITDQLERLRHLRPGLTLPLPYLVLSPHRDQRPSCP